MTDGPKLKTIKARVVDLETTQTYPREVVEAAERMVDDGLSGYVITSPRTKE